jgi:cation diffusion facilitator CzcD-associated flavoprotein CzcO
MAKVERQEQPVIDDQVIVIGAGLAGIYQIKRLVDLGLRATVLEAAPDLGGSPARGEVR